MEINILEEKKNKMILEIKGEGHSFCNAVKSQLATDKRVNIAGYNIAHPLVGIPKLVIETDSDDPKKVLLDAVKKVKKESDDFLKAFEKATK